MQISICGGIKEIKKQLNEEKRNEIKKLKKKYKELQKNYKKTKNPKTAERIQKLIKQIEALDGTVKKSNNLKTEVVKKTYNNGEVATFEITQTIRTKKPKNKILQSIEGLEILTNLINRHKHIHYRNGFIYLYLSGRFFKFKEKIKSFKQLNLNNYEIEFKNGVKSKLYVSNKKIIVDKDGYELLVKSNVKLKNLKK
jgi:hypothetical protein